METAGIYIGNVFFDEFVTTLTDVLVAFICFFAAFKLHKVSTLRAEKKPLVWYFVSMGLATLAGGFFGHAFLYEFPRWGKLPGWLLSIVSIYILEIAVVSYSRAMISERAYKTFQWLNTFLFVLFSVLTISLYNFVFVEIHTAYGFLAVVVYLSLKHIKVRGKEHPLRLYIMAVGVSVFAVVVFAGKIGFGKWFNHADLGHVFMGFSAWYFYIGSKRLLSEK